MEKHTRALTSPHRPNRAGWHGEARQGKVMGVGAQHTREWSTEIRSKASQARDLLLSFIFATSPCLIRFDRDRPSQLWNVVTLDGSSL
jgi:hypothetical protein